MEQPNLAERIAGALRRSAVSIFGPEWPDFNPMRILRNRVVDEWTDRLAEVPTVRDDLPVIGPTIFLGQETEMRKFNLLPPTADTDGDWEEMPLARRARCRPYPRHPEGYR
jgi:nitronate monooxygenase